MSANIWSGDNVRDHAVDNRAYVRERLEKGQPEFAAALRRAERQVDQERSYGTARPCDRRCTMNTTWLYHQDGSVCVDGWSCQEQDHTSVPPRCGASAADEPPGCELPKGHPGPHLHLADGESRLAENNGTAARPPASSPSALAS